MHRSLRILALVSLLTLTVRCKDATQRDPEPMLPYETESDPSLPAWAIGDFSRHHADVEVLRIASNGTALRARDGGDFRRVQCGRAQVRDGRVMLTFAEARTALVRDRLDRAFMLTDQGALAFERGALCGREVGGCGGYEHAEPCASLELERLDAALAACATSSDGGAGDASPDQP